MGVAEIWNILTSILGLEDPKIGVLDIGLHIAHGMVISK